jgi:hypothetical protein
MKPPLEPRPLGGDRTVGTPVDPFADLPIPKVDLPRRGIPRRRRARTRWPPWLWWYLAAAAGYLAWLVVA